MPRDIDTAAMEGQHEVTPDLAEVAPATGELVGLFREALESRASFVANRKYFISITATACNTSTRTIERVLHGESRVDAEIYKELCKHFGPDFFNETLGKAMGMQADWAGNVGAVSRSLEDTRYRNALKAIENIAAEARGKRSGG